MSRKNYIAIAEAILEARHIVDALNDSSQTAAIAFDTVITEIGRAFKRDNGRFDEQRFRAACMGD